MTDLEKNETVSSQESQTIEPQESINPWLAIWLQPRKTIRYIIHTNPRQYVILLSMIGGFFTALDNSSSKNMGDDTMLWGILALALFLGSLGGVVSLYIYSALIRWTGSWMNGQANTEQIRAAMAWSSLPTIYGSILWIPELVIYGSEMFTTNTPRIDSSTFLSVLIIVFSVIEGICGIWSLIVFYQCLGEVQGFSAWKALGNCITAILVVFIPVIIFLILVSALV